jgi:hypothetical protein
LSFDDIKELAQKKNGESRLAIPCNGQLKEEQQVSSLVEVFSVSLFCLLQQCQIKAYFQNAKWLYKEIFTSSN